MIIYEVKNSEKTKGYAPAIFLETLTGIYVESPNIGFLKHPTITTPEELKKHLNTLKSEGFIVRKTTKTAKA